MVSDTLPEGMTLVGTPSGTGWSCTADGQDIECIRTAALGSAVTAPAITITARIAAAAGPATLANIASVEGPAADPDPSNNTSRDEVEVIDRANVAIVKTASAATVTAGGTFSYTLTVTNEGPSDADNVQITDALPPGLSLIDLTPDDGVTCADGDPVDCRLDTLAAGDSVEIVVAVRVGAAVPDGTTIDNTATVSTSTPGDKTDDNTSTVSVDVAASADLSITKSHDEPGVVAGRTITFELAVTNEGPSDAVADVVVVDMLPAGMTYLSSTDTNWICTAGAVEADGQQVTCTYTAGGLPAGADAPPARLRRRSRSRLLVERAPAATTRRRLDTVISSRSTNAGRIRGHGTTSGTYDRRTPSASV